jgi:hypothetical protein
LAAINGEKELEVHELHIKIVNDEKQIAPGSRSMIYTVSEEGIIWLKGIIVGQ